MAQTSRHDAARQEAKFSAAPSLKSPSAYLSDASLQALPCAAALTDFEGRIQNANTVFHGLIGNAPHAAARWLETFEAADSRRMRALISGVDNSHEAALVRLCRHSGVLPVWFVVSAGHSPAPHNSSSRNNAVRLVTLHRASDAIRLYLALNAPNAAQEQAMAHDALQTHLASLNVAEPS